MSSLEDELALRGLMSRYVDAVNRRDAVAWAATWDEDATWNLLGSDAMGRDNILALWQQMMDSFEIAVMMPASCLFDIRGDQASGHWYFHEYTRDLEGNGATILSRYEDTYRKWDGEWLYQSRYYRVIYHGSPDLSGAYTPL